ncbi:hypothetical protein A2U01_0091656, partial [Trifolium medium]|nr:hypothetical protein [Trifolium medium]
MLGLAPMPKKDSRSFSFFCRFFLAAATAFSLASAAARSAARSDLTRASASALAAAALSRA